MSIIKSTICFLLSVALAAGCSRLASARGFCNIDGLGSKELQQVGSAAAVFFEGGSYLMIMLSAFERNDSNRGKGAGSDAAKAFGSASELYKSIKMPEIVDQKLSTLKLETAAAIAQTSPSAPLFLEIAKTAQGPNASMDLMKRCSSESEQMRSATAQFLEDNQGRERKTAALLSTWARVLFAGRTISAFFATAGGEK